MGVIRSLALACIVSGVMAGAVHAQVRVDSGALDRLGSSPSTEDSKPAVQETSKPRTSTAHKPPARHSAPAKPAERTTKTASRPEPAKPAAPVTIAPSAPPVAVLAPLPAPPASHPIAPPLIPMVADAVGEVSALPGGLRVTFGAGKADLSPATVDTLHRLSAALIANPNADVNVIGYAAGAPDDPSTPRRLSLSRALAVRAVLIGDTIASTRIYPRAMGSAASDGPADRVDIQQVGATPAPPVAATPAPASAAPSSPTKSGPAQSGPAKAVEATPAPVKPSPRVSTGLVAPRTP